MISLILLASGFGRRFGSNKLLYDINNKPMFLHAFDLIREVSCHKICGQECTGIIVTQYAEIESKAEEYGFHCIHNDKAMEGIAASVRLGVRAAEHASEDIDHASKDSCEIFDDFSVDVGKKAIWISRKDYYGNGLNSDWYVFLTADQPGLTADTLRAFLEHALESGKSMASACQESFINHDACQERFINPDTDELKESAGMTNANISKEAVRGRRPGNPTAFSSKWKNQLLQLQGDKGGRKIMKAHPEEVYWYPIPEKEIMDIDSLSEITE